MKPYLPVLTLPGRMLGLTKIKLEAPTTTETHVVPCFWSRGFYSSYTVYLNSLNNV
jgi:hypothetical protein